MEKLKMLRKSYKDYVIAELVSSHGMSLHSAKNAVNRSKLKKVLKKYPEAQLHQPISSTADEIVSVLKLKVVR